MENLMAFHENYPGVLVEHVFQGGHVHRLMHLPEKYQMGKHIELIPIEQTIWTNEWDILDISKDDIDCVLSKKSGYRYRVSTLRAVVVKPSDSVSVKSTKTEKVSKDNNKRSNPSPKETKSHQAKVEQEYIGSLIKFGVEERHDSKRSKRSFKSFFIEFFDESMKAPNRLWGVDLERALHDAKVEINNRIKVIYHGMSPIFIPTKGTKSGDTHATKKVLKKSYSIEIL